MNYLIKTENYKQYRMEFRTILEKNLFDVIPNSERCDACNDPRISRLDGIATCLGCGCVNVIKLHRDELGV